MRVLWVACCLSAIPGAVVAEAPATDHDIKLPASERAHVGENRAVSLTIAARPGFVISRDGPLVIDVSAPVADGEQPGIALLSKRYRRRDAADARADAPRFDVRYKALAAGQHAIDLSILFWVCNKHSCRPVRARRSVPIQVIPPPAPD